MMQTDYGLRYRRLYEKHWWWRSRETAILAQFQRSGIFNKHHRILDIGCGDGLFFEQLSRIGKVEGVEVDEKLVDPHGRWRKSIHVCPFDENFQPASLYSLILMLDVLEHLPDPVGALRHAISLLKPGGTMLLTVPAFKALWTTHDDINHHYTRYTKRTFGEVAHSAGMQIDLSRYMFHWTCPVKVAIRFKERLIGTKPEPAEVPHPWINAALQQWTRMELALCSRLPIPFGSSLMIIGGSASLSDDHLAEPMEA